MSAPVDLEPSLYGARVAAALVDSAIRFVLLVMGVPAGLLASLAGAGRSTSLVAGGACAIVAAELYAPLVMAAWNGQTVGHRALEIRVVRDDGERMDLVTALMREVLIKFFLIELVGVLTLGILPAVNYLRPLWNAQDLTLHDQWSGTRVVWVQAAG